MVPSDTVQAHSTSACSRTLVRSLATRSVVLAQCFGYWPLALMGLGFGRLTTSHTYQMCPCNVQTAPSSTWPSAGVALADEVPADVMNVKNLFAGLSCSNCFESRNDCFEASTILVDHPCMPYVGRAHAGFRRLGFGRLISLLAVPFIHGSFSYPTSPSILPDPFFRIYMKNMHRCKHGSDSGEQWCADDVALCYLLSSGVLMMLHFVTC